MNNSIIYPINTRMPRFQKVNDEFMINGISEEFVKF